MRLKAPRRVPSVLERARRYLQRCPPAISGQGGHTTTFKAACALVNGFALPESEALGLLREWNTRCLPPWSEAELRHKTASAAKASHRRPPGYLVGDATDRRAASCDVGSAPPPSLPPRSKPAFQPKTLERIAGLAPWVDEQFVGDRSPLCPETQTPASFLQRLFRPGESVIIFTVFHSQGEVVCTCTAPPYDAGCLDYLANGCKDGVWFLNNPVDGEYHPNPRLGGKLSRRSEESVTAWRYMVVESDKANPQHWLAALVQMPLPIAAIYTSGGRSIHALVRLDASSKADWDAMAMDIKPLLTVLGADPGAISAVRLTRLPGCYRRQEGPPRPKTPPVPKRWVDEPLEFDERGGPIWTPKGGAETVPCRLWTGGKLQELLYLDPEPDGKPIWLKPTWQEVHAVWMRGFQKGETRLT
jgi:hypothetical protein